MNAIIDTPTSVPATPVAPRTTATTLKLLIKREFWEHKGGFFWAPIWAGGISLLLTLMALMFGEFAARGFGDSRINGLDLNAITSEMSPADMQQLADSVSVSTSMAMFWPLLVLGFVVFFYCLGALYDERKDRSVLFWKSLPVSDRDTVLAKAISALVVAPAIALAVGIVCMIGFLVLLSVFVTLHHGNPFTLLWSPANLLASTGIALAALPIYALWALPSAGWLLLCSVWAKSKPFLWAIIVPVFAAVFYSWFDLMSSADLGSVWVWKNVVAHLLGGVFPGTWFSAVDPALLQFDAGSGHRSILTAMFSALRSPYLWVGAVAGVAMIIASIRLRRWRDDN